MDREIHIDWVGNPDIQDAFAGCEVGHTIKHEVAYVVSERNNEGIKGRIISVGSPKKASASEESMPDKPVPAPAPIGEGGPMMEDPAVQIVLKRRAEKSSPKTEDPVVAGY